MVARACQNINWTGNPNMAATRAPKKGTNPASEEAVMLPTAKIPRDIRKSRGASRSRRRISSMRKASPSEPVSA